MVVLHHDAADAIGGGEPDVVVLVLGNATDVVVAQALLLRQLVHRIILHIEDVHALASTYP